MHNFDSIVVGGGLIGSAVSYGLARLGQKVLMLDESDNSIRAARGNFGLIWVQGKGVNHSNYADWTRQSARQWSDFSKELSELTNIDLAFEQSGGFDFCLNEKELGKRKTMMEKMAVNSVGEFNFEMLNNSELKQIMPKIGPSVAGASFSQLDGHVNPLNLLKALHKGFIHLSGILTSSAVIGIQHHQGVFQVRTKNSNYTSDKVILAAGFSNKLLATKVGLQAPLHPQRGEILVSEKIPPFLKHPTGLVRQTKDGGVLLGDSHEDVGFDEGVNINEMQKIAKRAIQIFPFLQSVKMVRAWGSLRILTNDGLPLYDQSKTCPGAFALSSHSGVTLAPVHALDIAGRIAKNSGLPPIVECFNSDRFDV